MSFSEKLLKAVEKRSSLWAKDNYCGKFPNVQAPFWEQIAKEVFADKNEPLTGNESQLCREKWEAMRNRYTEFMQFLDSSIYSDIDSCPNDGHLPMAIEFYGCSENLEPIVEEEQCSSSESQGSDDGNPHSDMSDGNDSEHQVCHDEDGEDNFLPSEEESTEEDFAGEECGGEEIEEEECEEGESIEEEECEEGESIEDECVEENWAEEECAEEEYAGEECEKEQCADEECVEEEECAKRRSDDEVEEVVVIRSKVVRCLFP